MIDTKSMSLKCIQIYFIGLNWQPVNISSGNNGFVLTAIKAITWTNVDILATKAISYHWTTAHRYLIYDLNFNPLNTIWPHLSWFGHDHFYRWLAGHFIHNKQQRSKCNIIYILFQTIYKITPITADLQSLFVWYHINHIISIATEYWW